MLRQAVADRGYTKASAGEWADPLRKIGVELAYDLQSDQVGRKGDANGAIQASGCFYCPMTPESLLEVGELPWFSPTPDRESHFRDVERRDTFACEPHGRADRDTGDQRFVCPATAKKVRCPLKPDSMRQPPSMRRIAPNAKLIASPPPICSQQTTMMPGAVQANLRQKYPHGSPEWYDAYSDTERRVVLREPQRRIGPAHGPWPDPGDGPRQELLDAGLVDRCGEPVADLCLHR